MGTNPKLNDKTSPDVMTIEELWESLAKFSSNRAVDNHGYKGEYPLGVRMHQMVTLEVIVKGIKEFHNKFAGDSKLIGSDVDLTPNDQIDPSVTLTNNDLVDLANDLAKCIDQSPGALEYWLKVFMRDKKDIDFFVCDKN